jgi:hypothetical protein
MYPIKSAEFSAIPVSIGSPNQISDSVAFSEDTNITASTSFVTYGPAEGGARSNQKMQQLYENSSYKEIPVNSQKGLICRPGDVIVLAGTSTAGKSSIVAALKKIDPTLIEEDLDLRNDTQILPSANAQQEMMDDVIKHSLLGKRVIVHVDQAYKFLNHLLEKNVEVPVTTVLAFCPFHELSQRLIERNRKAQAPGGNPQNLRDPLMPIDNFANLYTQTKTAGQGLETITRDRAIEIHDHHFDKMIAYIKKIGRDLPPEEEIPNDKIESLQNFLSKLGFKEGLDSVEVEPRNKEDYNFIFDTHKYSEQVGSEMIAQQIYDALRQ